MSTIKEINKLIDEQIKEVYDTMGYHGDKHNLVMQPYLHTFDKIKKLVQSLSEDISNDLNAGAVDVIILKRTIFDLMDDLIRAISYEKAKLESELADERDDEDQ
tara:strand:+ start:2597 stop:2908 length:312 start_codon:yes stop_codon:yes gene_type:complete